MYSFVEQDYKKFTHTRNLVLTIVIFQCVVSFVFCQSPAIPSSRNVNKASTVDGANNKSEPCECVDYWNCTSRNGQFYSYCGISEDEVCCYLGSEKLNKPSDLTVTSESTTRTNNTGNSSKNDTVWSPAISPTLRPAKQCGVPSIPGNLDSVAEFREWPWHVGILEAKDDLYICGGSIISQKYVLTAAHCVSAYLTRNTKLKIRAGEFDISTNSESSPHVELLVKSVTLHPEYSNSSLINDIALLELVRNIPIRNRDNIGLVCLPNLNQHNLTIPGRCVVTGWGRLNEQAEHSIRMKEIIVPVWDPDQCERKLSKTFGPAYRLPWTSLCAGDEGRDACDGDGGGAMVCFQHGKWVQHGIVSFGVGCGRRELPGVYTRVSSFVNWIKSITRV